VRGLTASEYAGTSEITVPNQESLIALVLMRLARQHLTVVGPMLPRIILAGSALN
jgi:hypothetical protein